MLPFNPCARIVTPAKRTRCSSGSKYIFRTFIVQKCAPDHRWKGIRAMTVVRRKRSANDARRRGKKEGPMPEVAFTPARRLRRTQDAATVYPREALVAQLDRASVFG